MAFGFYTGNRLRGRISYDQALKVINFVLIVSGASLIRKAPA